MRGIVPIRFVSLKDKTPVGEIMRQAYRHRVLVPAFNIACWGESRRSNTVSNYLTGVKPEK